MLAAVASLVIILSPVAADPGVTNSVYEKLTQNGVPLHSGEVIRLPPPVMPNGLNAEQQTEILKKVAGKFPFDRFVRDSAVAPFVLEINSVENDKQQRGGQRLDFYFVAYASREVLFEEGLFTDLVGVQEGKSAASKILTTHTLTAEELQARKLPASGSAENSESLVAVDAPILERVQLQGVGIGVKQKSADSLLGAWMLDDRFVDDAQYPNRWRPILRDQAGRETLGNPTPYSGLGGYIKITWLHEPQGAVLVECHAAFDEPHGWFEGKNLLRSKLPLVVQDNVRDFRRKLAKRSGK